MTHVDGDGMIEKTRFKPDEYAVETLYNEVFKPSEMIIQIKLC